MNNNCRFGNELNNLQQEKSNVTLEIQTLQNELEIYKQLGELKHVQENLQQTKEAQKKNIAKTEDTTKQVQSLQDDIHNLQEKIRTTDRTIRELNLDVEDTQKSIFSIERTINDVSEKIEIDDANIMKMRIRLEELKSIVYDIYEDVEIDTPSYIPFNTRVD